MMSDRDIPGLDVRSAVGGTMYKFTGQAPDMSDEGHKASLTVLCLQHLRTRPKGTDDQISDAVREGLILSISEDMGASGIEIPDYELAMKVANNLFVFGELDMQRGLGGAAYQASRRYHTQFAEHVRVEFVGTSDYLKDNGEKVFGDVLALDEADRTHEALLLRRGIIHSVALDGSLGQAALKHFDPVALIPNLMDAVR